MDEKNKTLEIKSEVNDSSGNTLDSRVISNVITYIYGEPKAVSSISRNLKISPVRLQIYLNFLIEQKIVELFEERDSETIEKKYRICPNSQDASVNIKVDSNIALLQYADELSSYLKKSILSLRAGDINELSCYIGSVPEESLKEIIHNIQKVQNDVEKSEKTIKDIKNAPKYMLLTVFVPYKDDDI